MEDNIEVIVEENVIEHKIPLIFNITYSENHKVNLGNYESKDYFCSVSVQEFRGSSDEKKQPDYLFNIAKNFVRKKIREAKKEDGIS